MEVIKTIGSDPENDIVIKNKEIAPFHARVIMRGDNYMAIEGMDENKGVFVNNRRIRGQRKLEVHDILCLGDYLLAFEFLYPEFLQRQKIQSERIGEETSDNSNEEEIIVDDPLISDDDSSDEEEDVLRGMSGLKRWIYSRQFPKNRQKMHRLWVLIISSLMLLTIVLPYLSWGNPMNFSFYTDDKFDPVSGWSFFLDLLDISISGAPLIYIVLYGIVFLISLGVSVMTILFFFYGTGLWRPKNVLTLRGMSISMLILYALMFFFQFTRFLWYWLDGEKELVNLIGFDNRIEESRIFIENFGIGFWICMVGMILIYRSTSNRLWIPRFNRKWATLSVSFWIPFVVFLCLVHSQIGVTETNINKDRFKNVFGGYKSYSQSKKIKERNCQSASQLGVVTYVYQIERSRQSERPGGINSMDAEVKKRDNQILGIWIVLNLLLVLLLFQMFYRKISGNFSLVVGGVMTLLGVCLYFLLSSLLADQGDASFATNSVGYAVYITIVAGLGMLAEQLYFWYKKNQTGEAVSVPDETIDQGIEF